MNKYVYTHIPSKSCIEYDVQMNTCVKKIQKCKQWLDKSQEKKKITILGGQILVSLYNHNFQKIRIYGIITSLASIKNHSF